VKVRVDESRLTELAGRRVDREDGCARSLTAKGRARNELKCDIEIALWVVLRGYGDVDGSGLEGRHGNRGERWSLARRSNLELDDTAESGGPWLVVPIWNSTIAPVNGLGPSL